MGFFNDIRGMLSSQFEGRYLENIISLITKYEKMVLLPFLDPCYQKKSLLDSIECETEYRYKDDSSIITVNRSADLIIRIPGEVEILIEIKSEDGGSRKNKEKTESQKNNLTHNESQLKDYIEWLDGGGNHGANRRLVLLNKYYSVSKVKEILDKVHPETRKKIKNLTFSEYAKCLKAISDNNGESSFFNLLIDYFSDEGLVMFELNKEDMAAFTSFMVLNFLPHASGHGKQAVRQKISQGPEIFSKLIKNWQLASEQFSDKFLQSRMPTIRYWPHQDYAKLNQNLDEVGQVGRRNSVRNSKVAGTWTIYSDSVIDKSNNRLEFGIVYRIELGGNKLDSEVDSPPVQVSIYCLFRNGSKSFYEEIKTLKNGLDDKCFSDSLSFVSAIKDLVLNMINNIDDKTDDLKSKNRNLYDAKNSLRDKLNGND